MTLNICIQNETSLLSKEELYTIDYAHTRIIFRGITPLYEKKKIETTILKYTTNNYEKIIIIFLSFTYA